MDGTQTLPSPIQPSIPGGDLNVHKFIQTNQIMQFDLYLGDNYPQSITTNGDLHKGADSMTLPGVPMPVPTHPGNLLGPQGLPPGTEIDERGIRISIPIPGNPVSVGQSSVVNQITSPGVQMAETRFEMTEKGRRSWKGKYSNALREKARELKQQGMSFQAISKTLQVGSPGTVRRWISSNVGSKETLGRRGRRRKLPREVEQAIIQLYEEKAQRGLKCSARELAEQINNEGFLTTYTDNMSNGAFPLQPRVEIKPQQVGEVLRRHNAATASANNLVQGKMQTLRTGPGSNQSDQNQGQIIQAQLMGGDPNSMLVPTAGGESMDVSNQINDTLNINPDVDLSPQQNPADITLPPPPQIKDEIKIEEPRDIPALPMPPMDDTVQIPTADVIMGAGPDDFNAQMLMGLEPKLEDVASTSELHYSLLDATGKPN